MATKTYHTRIDIELSLVGQPSFDIRLNGVEVDKHITADLSPGVHCLEIVHRDKQPDDSVSAIVINSITLNDITSDKFVWAGIYSPDYPEPWATEQKAQGVVLPNHLSNTGYLGWNGIWRLEFTAPIFTWIHHLEDLGWIYD